MAVCNIGHISKVKQISIFAELETSFPCPIGIDQSWSLLDVAGAKNTGRPNRAGEEFGAAICGEDKSFCFCLEGRKRF